jgi:hypothetical protein
MADVYETGKAPVIRIEECKGDLVVTAWTEPSVRSREGAVTAKDEASLTIHGDGDVRLNVPTGATLEVAGVHGDAAVKGVSGPVSIGEVRGDLAFTLLSSVKLGAVHGDLAAKSVSGMLSVEAVHGDAVFRDITDLAIGRVHGDCVVRSVAGSVSIEEVMGDLQAAGVIGDVHLAVVHRDANLQDIGGLLTLDQARGDIRLSGPLGAGAHELAAEGDIVIRWPAGAPLALWAESPNVSNRLALVDLVREGNVTSGRIGEGKTQLSLAARGRIILKEAEMFDEKMGAFGAAEAGFDPGPDFEDFAAQIRGQVEEQISRIGRDLETKFGPEFGRRIAEQVARKSEKAVTKAERAAEKARRKAERGGFDFTYATPPAPPAAARKSDATAEQLKILKMVENGTISPDEANMLLEALGS